MNRPSLTSARSVDELAGRLAEEFIERMRRGEKPTIAEYAKLYPELADLIHRVFPALEVMGETNGASHLSATSIGIQAGVLGDYQIIREVGRGGMGVVYEARQISLDRRVALKVLPFAAMLDERPIKRFRNEARAAAQLKHANIVQVFGVGCERSVHFYAMEFVEGETLARVIAGLRQIEGLDESHATPSISSGSGLGAPQAAEEDTAKGSGLAAVTKSIRSAGISTVTSTKSSEFFRSVAQIGVQLADALDHAHQEGVTHRDVKPSNVMIDGSGKAWITDFGLARIETDAGMTMTGDLVGTMRYMSPEQTLAKRMVIDHRTDIYSLGVTLYELLTLRPAFPQDDQQELLRNIAFENPRQPRKLNRHVPGDLETIVLKAIEKNPADRFETAGDFADDLRRYLGDEPIQARRPTMAQVVVKWTRRHRRAVGYAAATLLLTVVSGIAALEHNRGQLATALTERDHALADLAKQRDQLKASNDELRDLRNTIVQELRSLELERQTDYADLHLAKVMFVAGRVNDARKIGERYFFNVLQTRDDVQKKALVPKLDKYREGLIVPALEPTLAGGRFADRGFGIAPRLHFDGVPPLTIEAIATTERRTGEIMNLLAWTQRGGMALGTFGTDRWALWLADKEEYTGPYTFVKALDPITIGRRQHLAGVWSGDEARLYIDGKLQSRQPIDAHGVKRMVTGLPLMIGADPDYDLSAVERFAGVIEAARITRAEVYDEEFDPPEQLEKVEKTIALYDLRYDDGGYAYDRSGNGYHAILADVEPVPRE